LGLSAPLLLGAAISGAIFGDHASPISDTTVVASMASATDHIEHVRTQLPYALLAASIATVMFFVAGFVA
jgi:Na+/H+ antiporter NhaC